MINIAEDLEPNTTASTTIITEQDLSPPQAPSPPQYTTIQSQPASPEPMQLYLPDPPENILEHTTLTIEALIQTTTSSVTILSVESQIAPILQVLGTQSRLSTVNVDIPINKRETLEVSLSIEAGAQTVQKEPETTLRQTHNP
jgi:hypothetical protein